MNPAMVVVWVLGLWLAWREGVFTDGWLHAKLALVFAAVGLPRALSAAGARTSPPTATPARRSSTGIANEVPTVLLIGIVILVIVKPF